MGINSRYPYASGSINSSNTASSQQQETETAQGDPSGPLTVEELSLSLEAVTRKVTIIEGRMFILEASFETLLQKTFELREELRLANEQLAIRNRDLLLERRSTRTDSPECDEDNLEGEEEGVEYLRIEGVYGIGER